MEAGLVVLVIRAHETIPDIEVESIVAAHLFVMLDVIGGCVQHFAQPGFHQPLGEVFIAGVTEHIEDDLPDHEGKEGQRMHRHGEDQQREDAGLNRSLQGRKAVGGPRRGVRALMMHTMEELKSARIWASFEG